MATELLLPPRNIPNEAGATVSDVKESYMCSTTPDHYSRRDTLTGKGESNISTTWRAAENVPAMYKSPTTVLGARYISMLQAKIRVLPEGRQMFSVRNMLRVYIGRLNCRGECGPWSLTGVVAAKHWAVVG